jgi:hypothetical protein
MKQYKERAFERWWRRSRYASMPDNIMTLAVKEVAHDAWMACAGLKPVTIDAEIVFLDQSRLMLTTGSEA